MNRGLHKHVSRFFDRFGQQPRESLAAERNNAIANPDLEKIVERFVREEVHDDAGCQSQRLPAAQSFGTIIARLADDGALSGAKRMQGP